MANKTSQDAFERVIQARVSSLEDPTDDYLVALSYHLQQWQESVQRALHDLRAQKKDGLDKMTVENIRESFKHVNEMTTEDIRAAIVEAEEKRKAAEPRSAARHHAIVRIRNLRAALTLREAGVGGLLTR